MKNSFLVVFFLIGSLLSSCARVSEERQGIELLEKNPLMAEAIAEQMIDYVTALQIRASEFNRPIEDPAILRAIDDAFVYARALRDGAYKMQDEGKGGRFHGLEYERAEGRTLLYGASLFFGYDFRVDAAPGVRVILAQHVAPLTEGELLSEPVRDLGTLRNLIGPQEYEVGSLTNDEWNKFRTVVLYSQPLKRVIGLAQIRGLVKE